MIELVLRAMIPILLSTIRTTLTFTRWTIEFIISEKSLTDGLINFQAYKWSLNLYCNINFIRG